MPKIRRSLIGPVPTLGRGLIIGFLCALLVFTVGLSRLFAGMERGSLDTLFYWRGERSPSKDIVIVVVDQSTVEKLEQWPLPRNVYAEVLHRLQKAGARTVAFDVMFPYRSTPADDKEFEQASKAIGNVVHASVFVDSQNPEKELPAGNVSPPPKEFTVTDRGAPAINAVASITAYPELLKTSASVGHIYIKPEWDGVLRRIPHIINYRGTVYPSLAMSAAAHFLGLKPRDIVAAKNELLIGGRRIPVNSDGETLVNWVGGNRSFPTYTFTQILNGEVPDDAIKDSIVLVGVTVAGAYEKQATPFAPLQPAVELQANALDNILLNRPLREIDLKSRGGVIFFFAMLAGVLVAHLGAWQGTVRTLLLSMALWIASLTLMARFDVFLPFAQPMLAAVLTCVMCVGYQQVRDARELKLAEERYALAVRGANDGIWDWNLKTDEVYYSPRWKSMLGFRDHEIGNTLDEWLKRVHADDEPKVRARLDQHLIGGSTHFETEHRMLHNDGTYHWMLTRGLQISDDDGKSTRMAGSQTDITDRRRAEEQLKFDAFHDGLTGLPNRALFTDRLQHALILERRRADYKFAVLFLDLDEFKVINDSLGHLAGDRFLIAIAERLKTCLRPGDTLARLGGDEFVILLDDIVDLEDPSRIATRLHDALSMPFELDVSPSPGGSSIQEVFATTSIGIALNTTGYSKPEELLRDADIAMYRAKSLGRGRHQVFDEAMHARALATLHLETDLRRALEQQKFLVYYQPIVSLETGRITGFEALARWMHPERGLIVPGEFIKMAEETGLITYIDNWILREACRQIGVWQQQFGDKLGPLTISANVSSKQFTQANMVPQIEAILRETGLHPRHLKLEITEGVLMENAEAAAEMLVQLKGMGIHLSIDDFGTGYSSLSYLHRFPLDTLKIDRSFVNRIGAQGENSEIVWTIITLARNLNMDVIAEGIETMEQLSQLSKLTCDYGQGYLFAKPLPVEDATRLLEQNPQWKAKTNETTYAFAATDRRG